MRRLLIAKRSLQSVGLCVWSKTQVLFDELSDFLDERVEACALIFLYSSGWVKETRP